MNYNKVLLIGRLTKDIETAFTQTGTEYSKCSIAVDSGWGDKKKTCFIDFVCWSKTSQFLAKHFSKGRPILIEGELQLDTWEKDSKKHYKHTINVSQVGFAGGDKKDSDAQATQTESKQDDSESPIPF